MSLIKSKGKLLGITVIIAALVFGVGMNMDRSAVPKGIDEKDGLVVVGVSEAKEIDLNTKIPGKIMKIYIEEGEKVKAGDLIAEIDCEQLLAKKEQVEAKVKMAEKLVNLQEKITDSNVMQASGVYSAATSQLDKANEGARSQEVEQAKAYYDMMQKSFDRVDALCEKGGVSEQKRDEVATQLEIAKKQYEMAEEGARTQDIQGAQGLVQQAEGVLAAANASKLQVQMATNQYEEALAGLREVESLLSDTRILAPMDGTIVELNAQEAELVSTGMPIATVGDLSDVSIVVQVLESDLQEVGLGNPVKIAFSGIEDQTFEGKVKSVKAKPSFATKKSTNNYSEDVVAYEVTVKVEKTEAFNIFPGMTAYVQFIKVSE